MQEDEEMIADASLEKQVLGRAILRQCIGLFYHLEEEHNSRLDVISGDVAGTSRFNKAP